MQSKATTVKQYLKELPADRQEPMTKLHKIILKNLPKGFKDGMSYGMIGYFVPHSIYPNGYHCDPKLPLPFAGLASQKNFIAFYHMCSNADEKLSKWFNEEYSKVGIGKLDRGGSCIRFKKTQNIPYQLIGELCSKITVEKWIEIYEKNHLVGKAKK